MLTTEQQLQMLHQSKKIAYSLPIKIGFVLFILALAIGAFVTGKYILLIVAIIVFIVTLSNRHSVQCWGHALKAIKNEKSIDGTANISIETPLDDKRYYATIKKNTNKIIKFEFVPQGWEPVAGSINVKMYYLKGIEWPVILIGDKGIIVPRYKPKIHEIV